MKSLILAAGYATRLYPLTENFPKPLLEVQKKSILDRLIDDLDKQEYIDEHIIVSNHKFVDHFNSWKEKRQSGLRCKIKVLDDGSTENENRLGAVKDISFAIEKEKINDTLIVLAGDNVLDFSFSDFIEYQIQKNASVIMRYYEKDIEKLRRTGVLTIDSNGKVLRMQEKPQNPESSWACPPFYIYTKDDLHFISDACRDSLCNTDAPGDFISWFCTRRPVYAWQMTGKRYDIGNLKSYEDVQKSALK